MIQLREALVAARSRLGASAIIAAVIAAVCASILTTAGRTAAAEQAVLERVDEAGSRALVVTDVSPTGGLLAPELVEAVSGLSSVEWTVGLSSPTDARQAALGSGGSPIPTWFLVGSPPWALPQGSAPGVARRGLAGEAAMKSLGLLSPYGAVETTTGQPITIAGGISPPSPLEDLDAGVVVPVPPGEVDSLRRLIAVSSSPHDAAEMERLVMRLIGDAPPQQLRVESPRAVAELRSAISGDLGVSSRSTTLGVLGIGLVVIGMVVFGETLARRRDLGRARALGASRGQLLSLLVIRSIVCAVPGAALGTLVGVIVLGPAASPGPRFILAAAVLSILAAALAVLPPGLVAVRRDPVGVLRTP